MTRAPAPSSPDVVTFPTENSAAPVRAAYEHPWIIRATHWLTAVSLLVLTGSGLQIFTAFPSFGPKIPQEDLFTVPEALRLGGWLAGALLWHLTFMWVFIGTGAVYLAYQFASGRYRMVLFTRRDLPGVWPMVKHYFLFRAKPEVVEPYNPLQKFAYTATLLLGVSSVVTGLVLYNPVQFSGLTWAMGGYARAPLALFGDVRLPRLYRRPPGHGGASRLE